MTSSPVTAPNSRPDQQAYLAALAWAILHPPTMQAYRLSTGEDIGPALARYRAWIESNLIGKPGDVSDDAEAA